VRCPAVEDAITCDHQSSLKAVFLRSDDPSRNTGQFIWAMLKFLTKHCIRAGPCICRYLMEMKVTRDFPRAVLYVISFMTGETCHLLSLRSSQRINKQYLPKHQWLAACSHLFIPSFLPYQPSGSGALQQTNYITPLQCHALCHLPLDI